MAFDPPFVLDQALEGPSSQPQCPSQPEAPSLLPLKAVTTPQLPSTSQESSNHKPGNSLKRRRSENGEEVLRANGPSPQALDHKRAKAPALATSRPESVPFWGVEAIKPLTEANLERLQGTRSNSGYAPSQTKPVQHRRVSELSSSKRSLSTAGLSSEPSSSSRACSASSARFDKHLKDCNFDLQRAEEPERESLESWRDMMAKKRDSPEPDADMFHLTRKQVASRNEVLSPMLFPYRDLPINNQKTQNLVYIDDETWSEWGSNKPGSLPPPKPDLCITFKEEAFTPQELEKMKSPYIVCDSYAPSLTVEIKAREQTDVAERQNANNMIHVLQKGFALQKSIGQHLRMERKIRFVSTTHNSATQRYQAWFYVLKADGNPKWCCYPLTRVDFEDSDQEGFQTARRYNLNLCEYISETVFKELRTALAGSHVVAGQQGISTEFVAGDSGIAHQNTPSTSSAGESVSKRSRR
ncbi:MAG: hypothetical protein Q9166_007585 [cf. Caloplaca sp. 2 TL-2023]